MALTEKTKNEIQVNLKNMLSEKLEKYESETDYRPFMDYIVRDKIRVNSYSFIHSLYTSLGMSSYEQISKIIICSKGFECHTQWKFATPKVSELRLQKIDEIITSVGSGLRTPDRISEQSEILAIPNERLVTKKDGSVVDVYFVNDRNEQFCFDIKTVKPNKSGFLNHKRLVLTWIARANEPITSSIVFPYNPYHPQPYNRVGFNVFSENDVMIGEKYWDFIGGKNCYLELMKIFDEVGIAMWPKIKQKIDDL